MLKSVIIENHGLKPTLLGKTKFEGGGKLKSLGPKERELKKLGRRENRVLRKRERRTYQRIRVIMVISDRKDRRHQRVETKGMTDGAREGGFGPNNDIEKTQ